uniref:HMG box domain-containing protein n=1 Tax=Bactrocera dorsalis TaxID=27457 RepID=A0A034WM19_BACDO
MIRNRRKPQGRKRAGNRRKLCSKRSRERRRIEREQEKLRKMSLRFGKTIAPNFGRAFENSQRQLTRHPYLNYLRHFKSKHPRYGFTRILREGAKSWKRLAPQEKASFSQKEVLRSLRDEEKMQRDFRLLPDSTLQFDYCPQSLSARRNIERKLRNRQMIPRSDQGNGDRRPVRPNMCWSFL